jgi:uncharacterized membrane protein YgaE (UPF0421/DUF939 family)
MRLGMPNGLNWVAMEHLARTTIAAMASLYAAQLCKLPNAYWAAITTLIVMQSTFGATLTVSGQRFVGTAVGALAGALLASRFGPGVLVFGAGVFAIGVVCTLLHLDRPASALAGVTLALVLLVSGTEPAWAIAAHRFLEVSLGIGVALLATKLWPERAVGAAETP